MIKHSFNCVILKTYSVNNSVKARCILQDWMSAFVQQGFWERGFKKELSMKSFWEMLWCSEYSSWEMTIERWLSRWLPYENSHSNRNKSVSNRHEGGSNRMKPIYLKYQCCVRLITFIQSLTLYRTQCSVTSLELSESRLQCQSKLQWILSWLKTMTLRHRMDKKHHFSSNATRQMNVVMKTRYCHEAS